MDFAPQYQPLRLRLVENHRGDVLEQAGRPESHRFQRQLVRLDLGEIEHHVDDFEQVLAGVLQFAQFFELRLRQAGTTDEVGHAADGIERRADLVAHVGQEGTFRAVGALGDLFGHLQRGGPFLDTLFEAGIEVAQVLLDLPHFGDVLEHPDQVVPTAEIDVANENAAEQALAVAGAQPGLADRVALADLGDDGAAVSFGIPDADLAAGLAGDRRLVALELRLPGRVHVGDAGFIGEDAEEHRQGRRLENGPRFLLAFKDAVGHVADVGREAVEFGDPPARPVGDAPPFGHRVGAAEDAAQRPRQIGGRPDCQQGADQQRGNQPEAGEGDDAANFRIVEARWQTGDEGPAEQQRAGAADVVIGAIEFEFLGERAAAEDGAEQG